MMISAGADRGRAAVQLLRHYHIISLVNVIYGLEEESRATLWHNARQLFELDPDILNAVYLTPHLWTPAGRQVQPKHIIQSNQALWTYRNPIIHTPQLAPWQLFLGVKLTEGLFHLRPRALWRMLTDPDTRFRQVLSQYRQVGFRVVLAEMAEFFFGSRRVAAGRLTHTPGSPQEVQP